MTKPEAKQALAYAISEAASLTSVGRDAIYGAIARRELVARKLGGRTIILRSDLERWLDSLPIVPARTVD
jgi:excisionase family DNA binding protein